MSSNYNNFPAIVAATCLSEFCTHPFEVLKVRAQIRFNKSGELPSRFTLLKRYLEKYGVKGLYKGFSAGIIRAIQNQTIRLYLYDFLNGVLPQPAIHDHTNYWKQLPYKFVSAFVSAFFAGLTGNPWVVLKVRMIADKTGDYKNLGTSIRSVIKNDGYREFTKGTSVSLARGILLSSIDLTLYDTLKFVLKTKEGEDKRSIFFASVISSFVAGLFSYPLDVLITLHMNQRTQLQESQGFAEIVRLCKHIYSKNGFKGFYVGFFGFASRLMVYGPVFWNSLEFFNQNLSLQMIKKF